MTTFNVISHTHWDREWYFSFDRFRIRLVAMMDHVLEILEKDQAYVFHMDAQTVVLEDYLEIRTDKRRVLEKYVQEGRLIIGPWYVQNDFYLTSGEATIRNLLIGSRIAKGYGACARIGYAPDQFGNISQLPQILQGFGVDNFIFGRGYQHMDWTGEDWVLKQKNTEFLWEGPDGTSLTAIYLRYWYNNAQRFSSDIDQGLALLQVNKESFEGNIGSNQLLMMNGVDHLEAQEDLSPIIKAMDRCLTEDETVLQTTMEAYIRKVQDFYKENPNVAKQLEVHRGELRTGLVTNILQNTLSSRVYLKQENNKLQNMLEHYMERLFTLIEMVGGHGTYPTDYMTWLWKELIKNHAHDSICGCSADLVHENMEDRFKRIKETGEVLLSNALEFLGAHIDRRDLSEDDNLIIVFNPHQKPVSEVIELRVDFLVEEAVEGFGVFDPSGREVPYVLLRRERTNKNIYSPINLPGVKEVDAFTIELSAADIPEVGYHIYRISKGGPMMDIHQQSDDLIDGAEMSNKYLRVSIDSKGIVDITDKSNDIVYKDAIHLIDESDVGDNYRFRRPNHDSVINISSYKPTISLVSDTPNRKSYQLSYAIPLPVAYDFEKDMRSREQMIHQIDVRLTLDKDVKYLDVNIAMENEAKDHRLRAILQTGIHNDVTYATTPYDLVAHTREIMVDTINNDDQANSGLIIINHHHSGMAIFNKGLYEYEHLSDGEAGRIALTLFRGTGYIQRRYGSLGDISPQVIAPGGNCIRQMAFSFALCPMGHGMVQEDVLVASEIWQSKLLTYVQPVDLTKFNGGRPAVQGSVVSEIFYREDTHPNLRLPLSLSGIQIDGVGVQLTVIKKAEDDHNHIIRLFNSSDETVACKVRVHGSFETLKTVTLDEEVIGSEKHKDGVTEVMNLEAKKLLTLKFTMK